MKTKFFGPECPLPAIEDEVISLAHGGGGRLTHRLLEEFVLPRFHNEPLEARHDGAVFAAGTARVAFTTDSYVVNPLFFPGGDIGSLSVNGTVNDLAMCGALSIVLSSAFVIEEGLPINTLQRVIVSMQKAASEAEATIVTGDTKVVERGKCDKLFVTTSGIGLLEHTQSVAPASIRAGDAVLLSSDIGRHGVAVMASREGLEFATEIESDCACLAPPVLALLNREIPVHCLRDLTRGGLATCLVELAEASGLHMQIAEKEIPVENGVTGACEVLGLDPLYLANEGCFVAFVPRDSAESALAILREFDVSRRARQIGVVESDPKSLVTLETRIGTVRRLDMQTGEQLPRIC